MPKFSEQLVDDSGYRRPVAGASVYLLNTDGSAASTTSPNPTVSDDFGAFAFFAIDGVYKFEARIGGVTIAKGDALIGNPPQFTGPAGPADNTYSSYAAMQASDPNRKSARLVGDTDVPAHPDGPYNNPTKTTGGWVPQTGAGIAISVPASTAMQQDANTRFNDLRLHSGSYVTIANSNGVTDNRAALQALINAGDCEILARTYAIGDELIVPANRKITIQPGARFIWLGASPDRANSKGFFRVGSNVQIAVNSSSGGRAFFECPTAMPFVYMVIGYGVADVRVSGLNHYQCSGHYFDSSLGAVNNYDAVVIPKMVGTSKPGGGTYVDADVNVARRIRISDCDGRMATFAAAGVGTLARFCDDVTVDRCNHENLYAGVQWEGGNASFAVGAQGSNPDAIRKVTNVTVRSCIARNVECGYWGAFGDTILCDGVQVYVAHDVALDAEGCWNTTFSNFKVRDGYNGGLAMFWFNRNISFENGRVESTNKSYPLARVYNASLSPANNRDITFKSVSFVNLDTTGLGMIDTGAGPVRSYTMDGCTVVNATISVDSCNQVSISAKIRLSYRAAAATNVVAVTSLQGGGNFAPPLATISAEIYSEVAQPASSTGIYCIAGDFNSTPDYVITNSKIRMPLDNGGQAGIRVISAGTGGFAVAYIIRLNFLDGPIATSTSMGPAGVFDVQQNFNARGGVPPMG